MTPKSQEHAHMSHTERATRAKSVTRARHLGQRRARYAAKAFSRGRVGIIRSISVHNVERLLVIDDAG